MIWSWLGDEPGESAKAPTDRRAVANPCHEVVPAKPLAAGRGAGEAAAAAGHLTLAGLRWSGCGGCWTGDTDDRAGDERGGGGPELAIGGGSAAGEPRAPGEPSDRTSFGSCSCGQPHTPYVSGGRGWLFSGTCRLIDARARGRRQQE